METLLYTVIKSQNQYKAYCEKLAVLKMAKKRTRVQLDTVDLLSLLIRHWDEQQRPLADTDPVEFLGSLMKQHNIKATDLAARLGISKTLLSDILHYRRRMSREVIRKLAFHFKVPQELFNKPYNVIPAVPRSKVPKPRRAVKPQLMPTSPRKDDPLLPLLGERTGMATIARLKDGKEITIWNFISGRKIGDPFPYLITNVKPPIADASSECFFTSSIVELIDRASGHIIFQAQG